MDVGSVPSIRMLTELTLQESRRRPEASEQGNASQDVSDFNNYSCFFENLASISPLETYSILQIQEITIVLEYLEYFIQASPDQLFQKFIDASLDINLISIFIATVEQEILHSLLQIFSEFTYRSRDLNNFAVMEFCQKIIALFNNKDKSIAYNSRHTLLNLLSCSEFFNLQQFSEWLAVSEMLSIGSQSAWFILQFASHHPPQSFVAQCIEKAISLILSERNSDDVVRSSFHAMEYLLTPSLSDEDISLVMALFTNETLTGLTEYLNYHSAASSVYNVFEFLLYNNFSPSLILTERNIIMLRMLLEGPSDEFIRWRCIDFLKVAVQLGTWDADNDLICSIYKVCSNGTFFERRSAVLFMCSIMPQLMDSPMHGEDGGFYMSSFGNEFVDCMLELASSGDGKIMGLLLSGMQKLLFSCHNARQYISSQPPLFDDVSQVIIGLCSKGDEEVQELAKGVVLLFNKSASEFRR